MAATSEPWLDSCRRGMSWNIRLDAILNDVEDGKLLFIANMRWQHEPYLKRTQFGP